MNSASARKKVSSSSAVNIVKPLIKTSRVDKLPDLNLGTNVSMQVTQSNATYTAAPAQVERIGLSVDEQRGSSYHRRSVSKNHLSSDISLVYQDVSS